MRVHTPFGDEGNEDVDGDECARASNTGTTMDNHRPGIPGCFLLVADLVQKVQNTAGIDGDTVIRPGVEMVLVHCARLVRLQQRQSENNQVVKPVTYIIAKLNRSPLLVSELSVFTCFDILAVSTILYNDSLRGIFL